MEEKSLAKKILGFFIEQSPETTISSEKIANNAPKNGLGEHPDSLQSNKGISEKRITNDNKVIEHLAEVLAKANIPGPDYFEFQENLKGLAQLGLGEEKQFQAAWASFKAMTGVSDKSVLVNSAKNYLKSLETDKQGFLTSIKTAIEEKVGSLQSEKQQLQASNTKLEEEIKKLQALLQKQSERLAVLDDEVASQTEKLSQSRSNYEASFGTFTEKITSDIDRIQSFLS